MNIGVRHILKRLLPGPVIATEKAATPNGLKPHRQRLQSYITGTGIEIGALHNPMPVDRTRATVRYVDRMSLEDQSQHYPELTGYKLFEPDILADADRLTMIADGSEDFVIANHLLEHVADPIGALKEWYRVLCPGGILFLALPDKRRTFDRNRPRTKLAHLIEDHRDRGEGSRMAHFREYSRLVHNKIGGELERDVANLVARNYSIHFHVWIPEDLAELLAYLRNTSALPWGILEKVEVADSDEFIYVLQKPA